MENLNSKFTQFRRPLENKFYFTIVPNSVIEKVTYLVE